MNNMADKKAGPHPYFRHYKVPDKPREDSRSSWLMKTLGFVTAFTLIISGLNLFTGVAQAATGAIWTTNADCGVQTQDENHYQVGAKVYINGANFDPADAPYSWDITGQPGNASSDPDTVVASGTLTAAQITDGAFCFLAYTVQAGDDGEYKATVGGKHDNYRVDTPAVVAEKSLTVNKVWKDGDTTVSAPDNKGDVSITVTTDVNTYTCTYTGNIFGCDKGGAKFITGTVAVAEADLAGWTATGLGASITPTCSTEGNNTNCSITVTNHKVAANGTVKVTIVKDLNGQVATATSANNTAFPMQATWNDPNGIGTGSGNYTLSSTGFNNPNAYYATTADMKVGADYSTNEVMGDIVGATCDAGKPYALSGYSTGDSLSAAQAASVTATIPSFTNLQADKFVVVHNIKCGVLGDTDTTLHFIKVVCDNGWDIAGNENPSVADATGGAWMNFTNVDMMAGTATSTLVNGVVSTSEIPAQNCVRAAGWQFKLSSDQAQTTDVLTTTATSGTSTNAEFSTNVSDLPTNLQTAVNGSGGLWVSEINPSDSGYSFGALRCYNDAINGDNLEVIALNGQHPTDVNCIAYNYRNPTPSRIHLIKVVCPSYSDIMGNPQANLYDLTGGNYVHFKNYPNFTGVNEPVDPSEIPANCQRQANWGFKISSDKPQTGPDAVVKYTGSNGEYVTDSFGPNSDLPQGIQNSFRIPVQVWVSEVQQTGYQFGALRCRVDALFGDNEENIWLGPSHPSDVYCIAYNVGTVTPSPPCQLTNVTLNSGTSTLFKGIATTEPSPQSNDSAYTGGGANAVATNPDGFPGAWNTSINDPNLAGSIWVSNTAASPTNTNGGQNDAWRLFSQSVTIPANATDVSAQLFFTGDNSTRAYLNNSLIGTSSDYNTVTNVSSVSLVPGTNEFEFAVKNDAFSGATNPTGVIYRVNISYCPGSTGGGGGGGTPLSNVLSGVKFNDANFNGIKDAGEALLPGWVIYLDLNNNNVRDSGELFQTTGSNGAYSFTNLTPGTYTVREEMVAGWNQYKPGSTFGDEYVVTVTSSSSNTNLDFGNGQGQVLGEETQTPSTPTTSNPSNPQVLGEELPRTGNNLLWLILLASIAAYAAVSAASKSIDAQNK